MYRLIISSLVFLCIASSSCGEGKDSDSLPTDSGTPDTAGDGPAADPSPFTLTVAGDLNTTLTFDSPTCTWPAGSANFRSFWRSGTGEHAFVLVAEILGEFTGAGDYDGASGATRAKLQEEAGGEGHYYAVDTGAGDTLTVSLAHADAEAQLVWGEFVLSGMHGDGAITLDPQPIPIWCPALN